MTGKIRRPLVPGWGWPVIVVCLLSLNVAVCAITVTCALSSSYSVEPDYYEKALAWDELRAEFADPDSLGWNINAGITGDMVDVSIRDAADEPVIATAVRGICFHQAHADNRIDLEFTRVGDGRFLAQADLSLPGLWELRIEIVSDDAKTRAVRQLRVPRFSEP